MKLKYFVPLVYMAMITLLYILGGIIKMEYLNSCIPSGFFCSKQWEGWQLTLSIPGFVVSLALYTILYHLSLINDSNFGLILFKSPMLFSVIIYYFLGSVFDKLLEKISKKYPKHTRN